MEVKTPSGPVSERRRQARLSLAYPVKVWCVETGRFLAGQTHDLSAQGMMIEVQKPSLLMPGQRVRVGIAWSSREVVLSQKQMLPGVVVRSLGHGQQQHVAVSFDAVMMLPAQTPAAQSA